MKTAYYCAIIAFDMQAKDINAILKNTTGPSANAGDGLYEKYGNLSEDIICNKNRSQEHY